MGRGNPAGREPEGGFAGFDTGDFTFGGTGIHREKLAGVEGPAGDLDTAQLDDIGIRGVLQVIANAHRGKDEAEIEGKLAADHGNAAKEAAARTLIDDRNEAIADFDLEGVD